ncbi:helix-turn-helix domain-containing protein [Mesorhizobium sp. M0243]|uniref:helix-turn-helix domain-containing protein n=1 Tax=Mesorhizobium sp. M0243 TaxID=2956925 RepID=UPI0033351889
MTWLSQPLFTEREAAARLKLGKSTIVRLRLTGKLGYFVGPPILIALSDIDAFVTRKAAEKKMREGPEVGTPEYKKLRSQEIYTRVLQTRLKMEWRQKRLRKQKDEK